MKRKYIYIFVVVLIVCFYCAKKDSNEFRDEILAKIGDQNITVKDFLKRTELTIRPQYPALEDELIKRILLNNLIAEKLMALEIGEKNELTENEIFQFRIQGIKEQTMRDRLYIKQAFNKVKLDTNEIKKIYQLAGREYKVAYYSIYNDTLAEEIKQILQSKTYYFEEIYRDITGQDKIPQKTVKFRDPDPDIIHDALYSSKLDTGVVIGPLRIEENNYIVMKVLDGKYYPVITGEDVQLRWSNVSEKLHEKKANKIWRKYVGEIMHGKKVDFNNDTFIKLTDIFYDLNFEKDQEKKDKIIKTFWNYEQAEVISDSLKIREYLLDRPFLSIDNEKWTVREFKEAILKHPLVYRKRAIDKLSFKKEFRLAIKDLIIDHFLTKEAYKQSLDKNNQVQKTIRMWKDAYLALYHKDQYLKSVTQRQDFNPKLMKGKENYLSRYVNSLQNKYSNSINVNLGALQKIQLAQIQLFTIKPGVPYPVAVPGFPEYVMDGEFDYGKLIKSRKM